ncbi:hypothetical protein JXA05_04235 [Candidatus Peregrinibacteria bacterium]|nr:hypothetical protein [Candidatus Peregrinibacteria bacterium]
MKKQLPDTGIIVPGHEATVTNKGGYHFEGAFSTIVPGTPIMDDEGTLRGVTKPRYMVYVHSYGGEALFFEALVRDHKLLATRCENSKCPGHGMMYLPYRSHCPDCGLKMTPIDMTELAYNEAKVYTFVVTERSGAYNTLAKPIRFIDIEFPGIITFLKSYMILGEPSIGLRVVPVFRTDPTFTIEDLAWVPEGTKPEELPEGWTFSALPSDDEDPANAYEGVPDKELVRMANEGDLEARQEIFFRDCNE